MTRMLIPVLVVSSIFSPVVWAQPTSAPVSQPTFLQLPTGRLVDFKQDKLKAFTLDEFKIILHIYTDYRIWGAQIPKLQLQVDDLTRLSQSQTLQLGLRAEEVKVYQEERKLLTEKYLNENKLRHECENKPNFGSWIAWGTAAAMGVVAAVLAGILIAKD